MTPRIGSLFSGYGGLDLAVLEALHGVVTWHCEWEAAPSAILDHHWPGVPNLHDVTEVDWTTVPPVDILTGGYPCQPFSAAGKRKGTNDERHLWPYVREAIRVLRPRYTVLENVAGHRSLGFDRVLGDLAEDGMHVQWTSLRASDIGAPHHRERLFILVTPTNTEGAGSQGGLAQRARPQVPGPFGSGCTLPDRQGLRRGHGEAENIGSTNREVDTLGDDRHGIADPENDRREQLDDGTVGDAACGGRLRVAAGGDRREDAADATNLGCERGREARDGRNGSSDAGSRIEWGAYAPAVRRWERLTRPAPAPTEPNRNGRPRLSAAFAEWMMGSPPAGSLTPRSTSPAPTS